MTNLAAALTYQTDESGSAKHVLLVCPACLRMLRIRSLSVEKAGHCVHCRNPLRAESDGMGGAVRCPCQELVLLYRNLLMRTGPWGHDLCPKPQPLSKSPPLHWIVPLSHHRPEYPRDGVSLPASRGKFYRKISLHRVLRRHYPARDTFPFRWNVSIRQWINPVLLH